MKTMLQVGVEQDIPNLAKRHARTGVAEADIRYAHAEVAHTEHMTRLEAGRAWIALAYAQQRLALAKLTENELRNMVPVSRSAVASGSARPAQSLQIRRALLDIEDAATAIEGERQTAQARLARYVQDREPVADGPIPQADVDLERLRATLELNPEIVLADVAVNRAQAATQLARAEKRPDFGVSVSYGKRDPKFGDMASVMGSMTLPLWSGKRQEPRIRAAEAEVAAAEAEREDRLRELEAQFAADLADWRSAKQQWDRAREELLPLARERAELETASYAAGRAGLTDVVEAKTALALLELDILKREQATVEAATKLRLTYREHAHESGL
jgi:outer membrane protein, heavy metal efflux system